MSDRAFNRWMYCRLVFAEQPPDVPWDPRLHACGSPADRMTPYEFADHLQAEHGLDEATAKRLRDRELAAYRTRVLTMGLWHMKDWTLDTFPATDVAGQRALKTAREWIEKMETLNLYIYGPVGTGKTGLAIGIARALFEQYPDYPVEFRNVRAFLAEQRRRLSDGEQVELEPLLDTDGVVVVLDDLGAERPTEWALETIAQIVETRHVERGCTIVTTNYAPSALAERLGRDDPVIGQRIVSRLLEDATKIKLDRADLRLRKAA